MGGAVVITVLGIVERLARRELSLRLYLGLMLSLVFYATFLAWKDERQTATSISKEVDSWMTKHAELQAAKSRVDSLVEEKERRIQELSDKLQDTIRARPIEVKLKGSQLTEPAVTEGLRVTQRRVPSPSDEAPFALEVTVQSNAPVQPLGLLITCDGRISEGTFHVVGQAILTMVRTAIVGDAENEFYLGFASPPLTPQTPLVVMLTSKSPMRVTKIDRVHHQ